MQITNQYSILERLKELIRNLREINQAAQRGIPSVNLSRVDWVCPISLLPIISHADNMGVSIVYSGRNRSIRTYLNAIHFPEGTDRLTKFEEISFPSHMLAATTPIICLMNMRIGFSTSFLKVNDMMP